MPPTRLLLALPAAAAAAVLAFPQAAQAATIDQPFAADSGDSCHYGTTSGTLGWTYGPTTSPLPVSGVEVSGRLTDLPLSTGPAFTCRDDGYSSTVTFTAYSGATAVDRASETVDDATVSFAFVLGAARTGSIDHVVVQVCRDPVMTLPPSYCGKAVVYTAPPVA
ncbi:hypothetical protein [Streptomyces sp. HPF1205]|uniref:hypothetical protein n=1 Tax=Streptomyces sp. HPF1205 TaxID=2873262 RepID=UPI001CECDBBA|nr:hypothetical protein [Streptomyces sp. HPF1205]